MAAVAGLRGTGDWGTDERPKNFREYIMWRSPNGTTPILGLTSRISSESTDDPEFSWWDEPVDIIRLQVNGALGSGDLVVTVDSPDPSTSNPALNWGLATHLVPGDILYVEPAADEALLDNEYLEVTQVLSSTQFQVKRGIMGSSAASIGNDAWLLKIGSRFAEGTSEPRATSRNPMKYFNYTQIFKTVYDLTGTAAQTKARTGDVLKNDKKRRSMDHAKDIEMALIFGARNETTGDNGKPLRTFGGIRSFIPAQNTVIFDVTSGYTHPTTISQFLEATYRVFDWDTGAGDERVVFCGNKFLNELNKIAQIDANSEIQWGAVIKQWGMNLRELILPQGRLYFRTHPLMNRHSLYSNSAFILDFSALRYRYMKGRDTKAIDNIQNKGEDAIRGMWQTECGLEVRYGGLTLGYLSNPSSVATP